jgi:hypothetical protein
VYPKEDAKGDPKDNLKEDPKGDFFPRKHFNIEQHDFFYLQGFWPKSVYLKFFWIQLKIV